MTVRDRDVLIQRKNFDIYSPKKITLEDSFPMYLRLFKNMSNSRAVADVLEHCASFFNPHVMYNFENQEL